MSGLVDINSNQSGRIDFLNMSDVNRKQVQNNIYSRAQQFFAELISHTCQQKKRIFFERINDYKRTKKHSRGQAKCHERTFSDSDRCVRATTRAFSNCFAYSYLSRNAWNLWQAVMRTLQATHVEKLILRKDTRNYSSATAEISRAISRPALAVWSHSRFGRD